VLFDLRCYEFHPGTVVQHLRSLAAHELPILERHLVLHGCWSTDSGVLNRVYQLWRYRDLQDSIRRRAALYADPAFRETIAASGTYKHLVRQESELLRPIFAQDEAGIEPPQRLSLWTIDIPVRDLAAIADHLSHNLALRRREIGLRAAWQAITGELGRVRLLGAPVLGDCNAMQMLLDTARSAQCELLVPTALSR
jgi:hypothetical protein